jgi:hypothetical protein
MAETKATCFYSKDDLSATHHSQCMYKCKEVHDDMISCCNLSKPCTIKAHVTCAGLQPTLIPHLTFWYCPNCCRQDPALKTQWDAEETRINNLVHNPEEVQAASVETKVAEELERCLEELEDKENKLREAQQQIAQLQRQLQEQIAINQIPPPGTSNGNAYPNQERLGLLLDRARQRREQRESAGVFVPGTAFDSTRNQTSMFMEETAHQQEYATMIADAANAYPDYIAQEVRALEKTSEQLAFIRAHITDPKPFDGDVTAWGTFRTIFVGSSSRGHFRAIEDMERLRKLIVGDAYRMYGPEIMEPFAHPTSILKKLDNFYGVKGNAVRHHLQLIQRSPRINKVNNREAILNLFASVKQYALLCRQNNQSFELTAESTILIIESKLHDDQINHWRSWASKNGYIAGVDAIIAYLEDQLRQIQQRVSTQTKSVPEQVFATAVTGGQISAETSGNSSRSSRNSRKGSKSKRPLKCYSCREEHPFWKCPQLCKVPVAERIELVKALKVCGNCLKAKRHKTENCPNEGIKCPVLNCQIQKLHPILHGHSDDQVKDLLYLNVHTVLAVNPKNVETRFKIVPGHVVAANGEHLPITVMYDTGSSISLSEMSLLERAGWPSKSYELSMKWTSDIIRTESNARRHDVIFIPYGRKKQITLRNITAVSNLNLPDQSQDGRALSGAFPYLKNVPIPSYDLQKPQILLGISHNRFMACQQSIKDPIGDGPIAELSELGWTISGSYEAFNYEAIRDPRVFGYTCVHGKLSSDESVDKIIELIKHYFSQDSLAIKDKRVSCMSAEDKKGSAIIENTLRYSPEAKRYEVGLLWSNDNIKMPNNYTMACNRLQSAESRLKKLGLEELVIKQFKDEIASRQLVKVTREEIAKNPRANFVPGFIVFNKNKVPPKPRWVNDTAAECRNISLNSQLLKGPDNLVPLPQALCSLRKGAFAILADVKKMFNQIMLRKEDQFSQLALWRDCDNSREPEIYRQTRVIFGPKCSPSLANAVRIRHAECSMAKYPEAASAALNQMYMDDVLDSRDSLEEMKKVSLDLIAMFDEISWELTQFQSNSLEVLQVLPKERVSESMHDLAVDKEEPLITKVLGMFYDPKKDAFMFKLNDDKLLKKCQVDDYHPTRKEMISLVMRVYDPLGLISHFHVHGRLVLQEMCRHGIDWKKRVPDEIYTLWQRWLKCFESISRLAIPRRFAPVNLSESKVTLHLFVDASQDAYACCVYIRVEFQCQVHVRLIAGKARVAPIKHMTIPKLELNAAVMGARMLNSTKEWMRNIDFKDYTAWSDSITVLRWLYAPHIRHKQYVAPRIAEIQELTSIKSWRYVPTDVNVADLATKWLDIDYSDPSHPWHIGPEFLYKPDSEWPQMPQDFSRYLTDEVPASKNHETVMILRPLKETNPWQAGILTSVSSRIRADWETYRSVVATAFSIAKLWKAGKLNDFKPQEVHSNEDLDEAEEYIIREIQKATLYEEYEKLTKKRTISASSKLHNLAAFMCPKGIIRARTRLPERLPYSTRFPAILPNVHETTDAIVKYYHLKHKHVGDGAIIGSIRTKYWIISTKRAVRRARARCVFCIMKRAKPEMPEIGQLPDCRVDPTNKPFFYTGVDCFGPFEVYIGRSRRKKTVWMIIFTCLITRGVFLEVLDEMSTNNVITVIEKLWARRGPIGHFFSDNGRNFLGAANLLENELFQHKMQEKRIKWHFQPPYAPHFGGVWERLIKDVKRALEGSVGKFPIPRLALESALAQIESNMNDRPLTDVPITPDDLEPLTPNLLISGYSNHPFMSNHDITIDDLVSKKYVRCAKAVVQAYMKRWTHEVLPEIARHRVTGNQKIRLKENDVVIYVDPTKSPSEWERGVISRIYKGPDKGVRVADIRLSNGDIIEGRAVSRLAKLDLRLEHPEAESENYKSLTDIPVLNILNMIEVQDKKVNTRKGGNKIKNPILSHISVKSQGFNPQSAIERLKMSESSEIPIGVLTEEEREKYLNPTQEKIVHVSNIPPEAGLLEIWQAFRAFGQITTIIAPYWTGVTPFYAFIIYNREAAAKNSISHSRSFAIGVNSRYYRIAIEKPAKKVKPLDNRHIKGLDRLFMSFGTEDFKSKVMVVRMKQSDTAYQKIPLSTGYDVVRRMLNEEHMYDFIVLTTPHADIKELAGAALKNKPKLISETAEPFDLATIAVHNNIRDPETHGPVIDLETQAIIDSVDCETPAPLVIASRQAVVPTGSRSVLFKVTASTRDVTKK